MDDWVSTFDDMPQIKRGYNHVTVTVIAAARTDIPALLAEVERLADQHQCDAHNLAAMQATLDQQAKNCEKLLSDDKQQIATLKRALDLACKDIAKIDGFKESKSNAKVKKIYCDGYIKQAQEQEGHDD